jgi:hypothetical protein
MAAYDDKHSEITRTKSHSVSWRLEINEDGVERDFGGADVIAHVGSIYPRTNNNMLTRSHGKKAKPKIKGG